MERSGDVTIIASVCVMALISCVPEEGGRLRLAFDSPLENLLQENFGILNSALLNKGATEDRGGVGRGLP